MGSISWKEINLMSLVILAKFFSLCYLKFALQCARQGFALGLTVSIGVIPSINVDSLLKLIVDLLEVNSSMKGQVGKTFSVCFK